VHQTRGEGYLLAVNDSRRADRDDRAVDGVAARGRRDLGPRVSVVGVGQEVELGVERQVAELVRTAQTG